MKPKIFVTRLLPDRAMERLEEYFKVSVNREDRVLTKPEIITGMKGCPALLCLLTDTIDAGIINSNPALKVISNYAVGYNNIDVEAATARGIPVCNTPDVLTEATADLTWALLMAAARRIVESDNFTRQNRFKGWAPLLLLGQDVYGKTIGIIGTGRIGSAIAHRASGFNMKILYHDQRRNPALEKEFRAVYRSFDDLLKESDYITIHVPLTEETTDLFGDREFEMMKKNAILVNTARGQIVDETALIRALKEKKIAAAGIDVYYNEPELTPGLTDLPNLVLTPHTGSATVESRTGMGIMAAENAIAVFEGRKPHSIVNPQVFFGKYD